MNTRQFKQFNRIEIETRGYVRATASHSLDRECLSYTELKSNA